MRHVVSGIVALLLPLAAGTLSAQDPEKPAPLPSPVSATAPEGRPGSRPELVALRIQLVLTKYDGEKKVSSLPYSFVVNPGDSRGTQLRMGVEVPVPVTTFSTKEAGASAPTTSYQYRSVGTNIDCTQPQVVGDGRYRLYFTVEQSSIHLSDQRPAAGSAASGAMTGVPMFRTHKSSFSAVVRDGQSMQFTSATDPVTGEVNKVDLTVNVVK